MYYILHIFYKIYYIYFILIRYVFYNFHISKYLNTWHCTSQIEVLVLVLLCI